MCPVLPGTGRSIILPAGTAPVSDRRWSEFESERYIEAVNVILFNILITSTVLVFINVLNKGIPVACLDI